MFSLDDNLYNYMPAFDEMTVKTAEGSRKAKKSIKIQHLFQMTSGMNYDISHSIAMSGTKSTTLQSACADIECRAGVHSESQWQYGCIC